MALLRTATALSMLAGASAASAEYEAMEALWAAAEAERAAYDAYAALIWHDACGAGSDGSNFDNSEDLAECEEDQENDGGDTENQWRGTWTDPAWVFETEDCEVDTAAFCTRYASLAESVGNAISATDGHGIEGSRCYGDARDYDDCAADEPTCMETGDEETCCCDDASDLASCDAAGACDDFPADNLYCPSGFVGTAAAGLAAAGGAAAWTDYAAGPDAAMEAILGNEAYFKAVNAGNVTMTGICEAVVYMPKNFGNFEVGGAGSGSHFYVVAPYNAPAAGKRLALSSTSVTVVNGSNHGPGAMAFSPGPDDAISLFGIANYGTVSVLGGSCGSTCVTVVGVENHGAVTFEGSYGRMGDVRNFGTVTFTGGDFLLDGVSNEESGEVSFYDCSATLVDVDNDGTASAYGGAFTWTGGDNTGAIVADGLDLLTVSLGDFHGYASLTNLGEMDVTVDVYLGQLTAEDNVAGTFHANKVCDTCETFVYPVVSEDVTLTNDYFVTPGGQIVGDDDGGDEDHDGHDHDEDDHSEELEEAEEAVVDCIAANCPEGFDTEYYSYSYMGDDDWFDGSCASVESSLDFAFFCQSADATCDECQSEVRAYAEAVFEAGISEAGVDCDLSCPVFGVTSVVTGDMTVEGMTLEDAQANEAVFVAAVADLADVQEEYVEVTIAAARRRRLADTVTVGYTITMPTTDMADDLASDMATLTTSDVDASLAESASDAGVYSTFAAVGCSDLSEPESTVEDESDLDAAVALKAGGLAAALAAAAALLA